ncbi:MAG: hypothetical protein ACP5PW_06570 [Candidatus Dormibacteria bacterium]
MSKSKENWKAEPDEHDYPAAANYLSLLLPEGAVDAAVQGLRSAELVRYKAKDLLRASRLPLLPAKDPDVVRDLREVRAGRKLSPVLLLRGALGREVPLTVADGYHRICASYHLNEDAEIPCRLAAVEVAVEIQDAAVPKATRGRPARSKASPQ